MLLRLDSPDMTRVLTGGPDEQAAKDLTDAIEKDDARLADLADSWADGEITRAEWKRARERIAGCLDANRTAFARMTHREAAADYLGRGEELRGTRQGLNLSRQVAIVKAVLDHAVITKANVPGRHALDPDRVQPVWRL